ncbi:hypothetical protein HMI55_005346 [Coelomomyces lativittatus]|nr:hypothetical protein HMI55_005346 [Coelomomyces lativittatus]
MSLSSSVSSSSSSTTPSLPSTNPPVPFTPKIARFTPYRLTPPLSFSYASSSQGEPPPSRMCMGQSPSYFFCLHYIKTGWSSNLRGSLGH